MMKTCCLKLEETKGAAITIWSVADDYIIELAIQEGLVQKLDTSGSAHDNRTLYLCPSSDHQNEYTVPYSCGHSADRACDPGLTDVKITGYEDLWNPGGKQCSTDCKLPCH